MASRPGSNMELNKRKMQMRKILFCPSLALDSAHGMYGVWPGPSCKQKERENKKNKRERTDSVDKVGVFHN